MISEKLSEMYAAYHVFLWPRDFDPLSPFPNSLAREVTISWSFTSRGHLSLLVATQDIVWFGTMPSWLLLSPAFASLQLLREPCCCISLQLVSPLPCLLFLSGMLSTCPPLDLLVLVWCEGFLALTQEIGIEIDIEVYIEIDTGIGMCVLVCVCIICSMLFLRGD